MALQITIPKGTRDFGTAEMCKRNFIFDTIKSVFRKFGFAEIETPAMENLSTLMGKYGDEGDKLLFKILNSGDFVKDILPADIEAGNVTNISKSIAEKGLRYDLTVPFARYVVQHRNELTFPFKRFQIQPVWRADKPQKGRYREFYQCDVDIIGSKSMLNEVELLQIVDEVFCKLNIGVTIKINNRKILSGIADYIGEPDKFVAMTVAIDKLDKIGIDNVCKELKDKGLHDTSIDKLVPLLQHAGSNAETISLLRNILSISEIGMMGLSEAEAIFDYLSLLDMRQTVSLDLCLARGLNYYTGTIFEVKANDVAIGSICGGGRYDNLTGIFGLKDISGVGISFGADRIFDVMNQLNLFPNNADKTCDLMFVNFGHDEEKICLNLANKLRQQNVACEIYPDKTKLDKQFKYANNKKIKYVAIVGENEIANGTVTIKDMNSGTQLTVNQQDMPHYLN